MPENSTPNQHLDQITGLTVSFAVYSENALQGAIRSLDPDCDAFFPFVGSLAQKISQHHQGEHKSEVGMTL